MREVHVECLPDECLVKKLGFSRKQITHHNDKGRVCNKLMRGSDLLGMIDEDPASAQPTYLKKLMVNSSNYGIITLKDNKGNKVVVIKPRLEDWIIEVCRKANININKYGLSNRPNSLHAEINSKLENFENLLDDLLSNKNSDILHLKSELTTS